jgi:hypothetical protein
MIFIIFSYMFELKSGRGLGGEKSEILISKQYLMIKIQMFQTKDTPGSALMFLFLSLGHLILEFVSNFVFRASDLKFLLSR